MGSGGGGVRSSMEAMLESLMRREEKPKDVPPALPPRPPSRGRLPSGRKSLPPLRFNSSEENLVFDPYPSTEDVVNTVEEEETEKGDVEKTEVAAMVEKEEVAKEEEEEDIDSRLKAEKTEKELKEKEEEVALLRQQLVQLEAKCTDYKTQVKSLQDQLSLQQQGAVCTAPPQVRRKEGMNGMVNQIDHHSPIQGNRQRHHSPENGRPNPVGQLMSEFENKKKSFEDDARALSQWKQDQPGSGSNPVEDLMRLKFQFTAWKRDFKVRLHDTKVSLEKVVGKSRRTCWAGMKWIKQ